MRELGEIPPARRRTTAYPRRFSEDTFLGRDVFTSGQLAKLFGVSCRTVTKWFDVGEIEGYRIPGSQDRRFPRAAVEAFARRHGIAHALENLIDVIALDCPEVVGPFSFAHVRTLAEVGYHARATVFVLDSSTAGRAQTVACCRWLAHRPHRPRVIVLCQEDEAVPGPWMDAGARAVFQRPVGSDTILAEIARTRVAT